MADEPSHWWDDAFEPPARRSTEQQQIDRLFENDRKSRKLVEELRRDVGESNRRLLRLRNATTALLTPIMLGMIIMFFQELERADGKWAKLGVFIAGAIGIWWLTKAGRDFDSIDD